MATPFDTSSGDARTKAQQTTPISRGLQVGDYQIEEEIGAGGMGTVYRAVQPVIRKQVAIKILAGGLARNANAVRRFVLEARTINEIKHPNLIEIYSFGQLTDGRYYYAMEFLHGHSLGVLLRQRGRLPANEVMPVFVDVARALGATHAKGVVHRDLKPDNVFLVAGDDGEVARAKLLDFGLAKLVEGEKEAVPLTAAGMAVGTPHYMAPEQCMARKVDGRTDLYALGVIMYEALTGALPCTGRSTVEIWEAHVRRPPRPPRDLAPDAVSPALEEVILKLLAKDPAQRFQNAGEVLDALGNLSTRDAAARITLSGLRANPATASEVARALPSDVQSSDLVPIEVAIDESPSDARQLRAEMGDLQIEIDEPAAISRNPNQVSAVNIQLAEVREVVRHVVAEARHAQQPVPVPLNVPPLAPPAPASSSGRLRRSSKSARLPTDAVRSVGRPGRGAAVVITLAVIAAVAAALVLFLRH